ncbi:LAFE_0H16138g1_1 [Lachancea fermentati]|uniref:ATP-dependent DNA helicase II subunit 2 n=1 Tax=Lachancea fermentati TaxID=4955 RepID=A0A1G4ML97_LACFM|nr:LAFE_0H16138g1_1 [Lachancea fermentati]
MASEATTFIVDVSKSMIENGHSDQARAYLEYTMLMKTRKQRKTDWTSCFLANCPLTKNNHETANVYEMLPLKAPINIHDVATLLQDFDNVVKYCLDAEEDSSSMVQCLLVASVSMRDQFNKRKVKKQIVVFTDDADGLDLSDEELSTLEQELDCRIIYVPCEPKREDRSISVWDKCVQCIQGSLKIPIVDLLKEISASRPSTIKPVRVFQGELRLGAPITETDAVCDDYQSLNIQVEGFPATKAVTSLNRKVVAKLDGKINDNVQSVVDYEVHNKKEENSDDFEMATVAKEYVTKAYRYGSDYVVLPPALEPDRIYRTEPSLDIRGFLDKENLPRCYLNSESTFIVAATKGGTRADYFALAALVDSMIKLNKLAIVRYVQKKNSEVQMCVACPLLVNQTKRSTDDNSSYTRALVLNRLPFAEDERTSDYPKLNRGNSSSNERADHLMSAFIDSMDLDSDESPTWYSTPFYEPIDSSPTELSTLPLPSVSKRYESDPLCIPSIGLHRQQQVLIEYIHQKIIKGCADFSLPDMPDDLRQKLTPSKMPKKELTQELKEVLDIKANNKDKSNALVDEQEEEAEEIPSLETLLARGRRDR